MKCLNIILSAVFVVAVTGCAAASPQDTVSSAGNETVPVAEQTAGPASGENQLAQLSVRWIREPDMLFSGVSELTTYSRYSPTGCVTENIGYPQEWDDTQDKLAARMSSNTYEPPVYGNYRTDAILVSYNGYTGIYDYDGEVIAKPFLIHEDFSETPEVFYDSEIGFIADLQDPDHCENVFKPDFRSVFPRWSGGRGWDDGIGYFQLNETLMLGVWYDDAEPVSVIDGLNGHNCLVQMMEYGANKTVPDKVGCAAYDSNSKLRREFKGLFPSYYVNGFAAMGTKEEFNDGTGKIDYGQILLMNMNTLEPITEAFYEDAKWFENGFCPVKKDGKWGYIDETGKEVTDFIWDDASTAYEGRAYVGINGVYGVLDLAGTISQGTEITMDTCYPSGIPEGKELETGEIPDGSIGRITINVSNLNTRKGHSTDAEKNGVLTTNSVHPVYDTFKDEEYTWYRIDDETWVADKGGKWVGYTQK